MCEHTKVRIWRPCCEAQGRDNGYCLGTQHMLEHKCLCQCLMQFLSRLKDVDAKVFAKSVLRENSLRLFRFSLAESRTK